MKKRTNSEIPWPQEWARPRSITWLEETGWVHSRVAEVELGARKLLLKVYGLPGGEDCFITYSAARSLVSDVAEYRAGLQKAGLRTPKNSGWSIQQTESGNYLVYLLESHEGVSLDSVLDHHGQAAQPPPNSSVELLIGNLFQQSVNGVVAVGVDPKPSNFVVSDAGELAYVDMVWPLNGTALEKIHPEIKPIWHYRYFTKVGICMNWLVQFSRKRAETFTTLHARISNFITKTNIAIPNGGLAVFESLVTFEKATAYLCANDVNEQNIDFLRALATMLAAEQRVGEKFQKQVFALTRTNPHKPLPRKQLQECRELILSHS